MSLAHPRSPSSPCCSRWRPCHLRSAQAPTKLRFQAAFPPSSLTFENFKFWAERVKALSGGRLQIETLPPGAVVPAFEVLDAVHKGVIDGGHTAAAYWVGKNRAATLFGPAPGGPMGMDMIDYMGWLYDAGGIELYREFYQKELKRNVVPVPLTSVANQVLGWFKTPVKSWEDLKDRKCRETGITAEVFSRSGMTPVNIPGGEIVPAGERGVIECAEYVGPAEDMRLGFHTVWKYLYMPSTHENATVLELLINGDVWNKLPPDLREIIQSAAWEATLRSQTISNKANARGADRAAREARREDRAHARRYPEEGPGRVGSDREGRRGEESVLQEGLRLAARVCLARSCRPGARYTPLRPGRQLLLAREKVTARPETAARARGHTRLR